jgi:hypothetical protein
LGMQGAITLTQRSAFDALPAVVAIIVALLLLLDYRSHSDLLWLSAPFKFQLTLSVQPLAGLGWRLKAESS